MKLKKKTYFYSIILSIIILGSLAIMPAFISVISSKDLFGLLFCIYFISLLLVIKITDSDKVRLSKVFIIITPAIVIYFLFPLFNWNLRFLPLGFSIILSGLLAYFFNKKSIITKLGICTVMVLFGHFTYPKYSLELSYQQSLVSQDLKKDLIFNGNISNDILKQSEHKLVVLEFWNSACGQCINAFPKFQEFFETYDEDYEIYSVNVPWRRDKEKNFNPISFVDSLGYRFPVLSMEYEEAKKLEVNLFPTVLVIDNRTIKYRGRLIYGNSSKYNITEVLKKIKK